MANGRDRRNAAGALLWACLICHTGNVEPVRAETLTPASASVPEIAPGFLKGYLPLEALPDSAIILPPPPAPGSAAGALDDDVARTSLALRDTPRWKLAALDARLSFPAAADAFSCALDAPVSETATPRLYVMLRRVLTDAGLATDRAKKEYQHARPFMMDSAPICTPEEDKALRNDGSYPSGHTAIGWAWALVLAEAAPDRADVIVRRGLSFGTSRIVCNVHWRSDVVAGRTIGAAAMAKLNADPQFLADLAAAREEIAAARSNGLPPNRDCKFEAEALRSSLDTGAE